MIEVLVAISIITFSILAMMVVSQKSVRVAYQSFHTTQASFLLEEGAEAMRVLRDDDWSNISSLTPSTSYYLVFSGGTWTLLDTASTIGIFTRTVTVADVNRDDVSKDISQSGTNDPSTKLITVTVSWSEGGTTVNKTLSFYLMDIFS